MFGVFLFHLAVGKPFNLSRGWGRLRSLRKSSDRQQVGRRSPRPRSPRATHVALCHPGTSVSLARERRPPAPAAAPLGPGGRPEGLTRGSSQQQSDLRRVPEGSWVPSVQNLWRKTPGVRFARGADKRPVPGKQPPRSPPSRASLCLAQSNQCADYCTTALSWTGSLNTGATGQDLQKLPSACLTSSPFSWS